MKTFDALVAKLKEAKEELAKNTNMSYGGMPNSSSNGESSSSSSVSMSEKEPHKDDPHHEEKEKKKASKIKEEAQSILDMHKAGDMEKMCFNKSTGQWYLEKKHIGFDKLSHKLEGEGHSAESAKNIAAAIGQKKYGKEGMAHLAHKSEDCKDGKDKV